MSEVIIKQMLLNKENYKSLQNNTFILLGFFLPYYYYYYYFLNFG